MTILADELANIITRMDENKQRRLLEFAQHLMEETDISVPDTPTLEQLARLPYEERNRAVAAALARSLDDDVELFDAYGERDFDDD